MSMNPYHVETIEHRGFRFRVEHHYDEHSEAPWQRSDGHGPVSDWRNKDTKRPGEKVLNDDDGRCRFYDWQEATVIAKRDGWGLPDDEMAVLRKHLGREPTRKEIVREAVDRDFNMLSGWCNDEWHYMGVVVRFDRGHYDNLTVPEGTFADMLDADECESLWGIESNSEDYLDEVAIECANALLAQLPDDVVMRAQMERPTMLVAA